MRLIRDKHNQPLDTNNGSQTVKSSIGSYTRTGRRIADTNEPKDRAYLKALRSAILERNASLKGLLW